MIKPSCALLVRISRRLADLLCAKAIVDRLRTIIAYDRILVLDAGMIAVSMFDASFGRELNFYG